MNFFISIVSHNHGEIISRLDALGRLSFKATVIVKNNTSDLALVNYCLNYPNIILLDEAYGLGFGENNNYVFKYSQMNLGMRPDDYFLVLNPDVSFTFEQFEKLSDYLFLKKLSFCTINLFRNFELTDFDFSVRRFPGLFTFPLRIFGYNNHYVIDKSSLTDPVEVDWAAGSFLCFSVTLYSNLKGFDERYFMYCEDIDICYRAALTGQQLIYLPFFFAVHLGAFRNRNLFNIHAFWHFKSLVRFLTMKQKKSMNMYLTNFKIIK
jgi:N-acetylglucosaminyl-diphospho-decaprenol L-rhamnosyltransferase